MALRKFELPKLNAWISGLLAGLQGDALAGLTTIAVNGKIYTVAALVAKLLVYEAVLAKVVAAQAALDVAVEAFNEAGHEMETFLQQARAAIKGLLGKKSSALTAFGMTPDKDRQPLTVEGQSQKVARMLATREARHTTGPRQRSKIKGKIPPTDA